MCTIDCRAVIGRVGPPPCYHRFHGDLLRGQRCGGVGPNGRSVDGCAICTGHRGVGWRCYLARLGARFVHRRTIVAHHEPDRNYLSARSRLGPYDWRVDAAYFGVAVYFHSNGAAGSWGDLDRCLRHERDRDTRPIPAESACTRADIQDAVDQSALSRCILGDGGGIGRIICASDVFAVHSDG